MIDLSFLDHLDRLSILINKRVTSNYVGERASRYTGKGLIFKDYTTYTPGDDFRTIDWKVFARLDKLFIKRHEEERNLTLHIIIDHSASMGFGHKKFTKAEYAAMFGIGFAYMALKNNEKFVLSTFADQLDVFRPRKGKSHLAKMIEYLNKKKPAGKSQFEHSLARYKKNISTKALVVIISDFLYTIEEIKRVLYRFKNNELILIQVLDDVEKNLQLEGDFKLVDSESKSILRTFISPLLRKNYFSMLSDHNANIQKVCSEIGAKFFSFGTDTPIFDAFYKTVG